MRAWRGIGGKVVLDLGRSIALSFAQGEAQAIRRSDPTRKGLRPMTRLLIIEDDQDLRDTLSDYFQLKGYEIEAAAGLDQAEDILAREQIDLVLLDLNLPDGDGLNLLRRLRGHSRAPVFVVSGRSDEASRLNALELSADDYIIKPVNLRELTLRVGNFLARHQQAPPPRMYQIGTWTFYPAGNYLTFSSTPPSTTSAIIKLTTSESLILRCLVQADGDLVPTANLLAFLQQAYIPMSRESLPVVVSRLRAKLQPVQAGDGLIESVPRAGYRFGIAGVQTSPHASR